MVLSQFCSPTQYDNETGLHIPLDDAPPQLKPTSLRVTPTYIVANHWILTLLTGIIPFAALLFLNGKIFIGLKRATQKLELHSTHSNTRNEFQAATENGGQRHNESLTRNGGL